MNRILSLDIVIFFALSHYSAAQEDTLIRLSQVINGLEKSLGENDPCQYKAQMYFKEFGGDTFELRDFVIHYQSNPENPLYGYDFEIAESRGDGEKLTIMALNKSMFFAVNNAKEISESKLPDKIDLGSYVEYIRSFLTLPEVYSLFINGVPEDITLIDSGSGFTLCRKVNELATNELVLDRGNYLPIKSISKIRSDEFDMMQITEIHFYFGKDKNTLPDSAFSPGYYLSKGYQYNHMPDKVPEEKETRRMIFTTENLNLVLHFPFIDFRGDTHTLIESSAKYILLDFWYASCLPCLRALPEVNEVAKLYKEMGLEVLGINCFDKAILQNVENKIRMKGIDIPFWFGSDELIRSIGMNAFPAYILITPDRKFEVINGGIEEVKMLIGQILKQ